MKYPLFYCSFKKKFRAGCLMLALSCIICQSLFSQFKFELLTANDGLSYNKVNCILQDKQGYIWFGTIAGLNRYDGYTFKIFKNIPGDSLALANADIVCLWQDKDDLIWIGTSNSALSRYDPHTETFKNYFLPVANKTIHDIKEDEYGVLWLATTSGLFSFDKNNRKFTHYLTDDSGRENVQNILPDKTQHVLWLASETGIRKFYTETKSFEVYKTAYPAFTEISPEITHNIIRDRYGDIWMATSFSELYRLNPFTQKISVYRVPEILPVSGLPAKNASMAQLMEDADGKIWIGGDTLAFFNSTANQITFYSNRDKIDSRIRAMLKDKNGIYWLGTERGVAKYDPKLYSFVTIPPNRPFTIETVKTIVEDKAHKCWVGNYLGLLSIDVKTGVYTKENQILNTDKTNIFYSSVLDNKDGSMWFGGESSLFHISSNGKGYRSQKIPLPMHDNFPVLSLTMDEDGILWAGIKRGGLFRYDPYLKLFKQVKGDESDSTLFLKYSINALHALKGGSVLIGTEGSGVILMHTISENFERIKLPSYKAGSSLETRYAIINAFCEDQKRNIWIGTDGDGLWQTDASLSKFTGYTITDGLQSMNIQQIIEDDRSQIWLNTNLGLDIIDPVKKRVVHFSEKDGLSINQSAYLFKKSNGDIIDFDLNGLHIFRSSSINTNMEPPPVHINYIQVLDKKIPIYNDTVIHLKYDENYISFEFVALNYTQSFKNRYKYKLEGLDKNWVDAGNRRFTSYANIGAGTYTFLVTACNNNEIWNQTPAKITFIISPPWWKTWWFYSLLALVIAASVYGLFKYRLQQELKAFELRNTISRDLHDEVGSTLSSIGFLSSMALNDMDGSNPKTHHTLKSISESSNRMLDAMNDIIWSIQPQNDTLNNIVARMLSFASEILEARKISLHYNVPRELTNLHIGIAIRHDFYVIFKEAVNNLAKYSEATEAHIQLEHFHQQLVLTIRDNGKGFDEQKLSRVNGLRNMENRARKIGAEYRLLSIPGKGTTIILKVKVVFK